MIGQLGRGVGTSHSVDPFQHCVTLIDGCLTHADRIKIEYVIFPLTAQMALAPDPTLRH